MFNWLAAWFRPQLRPIPQSRPKLEILEDRTVPSISSVFTVASPSDNDTHPVTASSSNGTSIVVWERKGPFGDERDIVARRYDANHNAIGGTFIVANSGDEEFDPDVSMDANGNFVITWTRQISVGVNYDVRFAVFNSSGTQIGSGVAGGSPILEAHGRVAMSASGSFVIAYMAGAYNTDGSGNTDILAKRYDILGNQIGGIIPVATSPKKVELAPEIDCNASGKFAISYLQRINSVVEAIYVKRYAANGRLQGTHLIARVGGAAFASHDVGIDNLGNVAIVYDRGVNIGNENLFFRRITFQGRLSPIRLLTTSPDYEANPRIAVDRSDGDFVVAYRHPTNSEHAFVREFTKTGVLKEEHDLGDKTADSSVSIDSLDRYFVAYEYLFGVGDTDIYAHFGVLN